MIGKYTARVDDKGRLFVPAKLRAELGETFYVTLGFHGSAAASRFTPARLGGV